MEILPGKREGTYVYIYEQYSYHKDCRYQNKYRCSKKRSMQCKAILYDKNGEYILKHHHNHESEENIAEITKLKLEMKEMCSNHMISNKEIFDTVSRKHCDVAVNITYNTVRTRLSREKIKSRPPLPRDIRALYVELQTYVPTREIFKGCAVSENNELALVFSTDKLLNILNQSSEIYVDGTFSVLPQIPKIGQLYSIHVTYMETGIATVFILCECRTKSLYTAMWNKVFELSPRLQNNLQFIMSDYEKAAIVAMKEQFPNAQLRGCWFHFNQCIIRQWRHLSLTNAPRDLLSVAMTLPLAPHHCFLNAFAIMQDIADSLSLQYPDALQFMTYLRRNWLPIASKSFHHTSAQKLGTTYPNLWTFLDGITKIITEQELNYGRLERGLRVRRVRSRRIKERDFRIQEAQSALCAGRLPLEQFLRMFHRHHEQESYRQFSMPEDYYSSEVYGDLLQDTSSNSEQRNNNVTATLSRYDFTQRGNFENISTRTQAREVYDINASLDDSLRQEEHRNNNVTATLSRYDSTQRGNFENVSTRTQAREVNDINASLDDSLRQEGETSIYDVPPDDYGYWINGEAPNTSEEDTFLSLKELTNESTTRDKGSCCICLTEEANNIFLPCAHLCCCSTCTESLSSNKCPMCNIVYDLSVKVFTT